MCQLIKAKNEAQGLKKLLLSIITNGEQQGAYLELLSCFLTISYNETSWKSYVNFKEKFLRITGDIGNSGWLRATRVYTDPVNKISKPSYYGRLISYPDRHKKAIANENTINQIESLIKEISYKPGYSCLSFVILRPSDLIDKFRPGYVPCAISGDLKFRNGKLNLSVMFRTNDALSVCYADIFYLRNLQIHILEEAQKITKSKKLLIGKVGNLNLYFCRTFINKYIRTKSGLKVNGIEISKKLAAELKNV